ncbi:transposase, partial [bacterium]
FPPTVQVHIAREPVDMRRSYDGLSGCVEQLLHADPLSGHLFVFFNRRRTQVKILVWDRNGYCIYGKKLQIGRFAVPAVNTVSDFARLLLILEGIDLSGARQRKRFSLGKVAK